MTRPTRLTQTDRIVALLRERRPNWVSLSEILGLRISQYGARLHQARHEWGLNIENRVEIVNGEKRSSFRLIESPDLRTQAPGTPVPPLSAVSDSFPEFGQLAKERYGVD